MGRALGMGRGLWSRYFWLSRLRDGDVGTSPRARCGEPPSGGALTGLGSGLAPRGGVAGALVSHAATMRLVDPGPRRSAGPMSAGGAVAGTGTLRDLDALGGVEGG